MRDRLIEVIDRADEECKHTKSCKSCSGYGKGSLCMITHIADHLLADGWMRPPIKIGQELWEIHYNRPRKWEVVYLGYNGKEWFINIHWWKDKHNFATRQISYPFLGKMWYFSREEAEKALKGKEDEEE